MGSGRQGSEQDRLINAWVAELRKPDMNQATVYAFLSEREKLVKRYAPRIVEKIVAFHASLTDSQREVLATRTEKLWDWQSE